jgi:hypothetical protein
LQRAGLNAASVQNPTKRMGAKTIEVKASHLSLISHPDEITGLILEAAQRT